MSHGVLFKQTYRELCKTVLLINIRVIEIFNILTYD